MIAGVGTRRKGFTLIELLVVMGVISILLALLVPTLAKVRERVNVTRVQTLIGGLSAALDQYKTMFNAYPPDKHPGNGAAGSALDKSSECLVYFLSGSSIVYVDHESPEDYPWRHPLYWDTSGGGSGRRAAVIQYNFDSNVLTDKDGDLAPEIIDPFGHRLIYNSGTATDGPYNQFGAPKHMIGKFDLISAGPDGKFGGASGEDDIRNWGESPSLATDYDYNLLNPPNDP